MGSNKSSIGNWQTHCPNFSCTISLIFCYGPMNDDFIALHAKRSTQEIFSLTSCFIQRLSISIYLSIYWIWTGRIWTNNLYTFKTSMWRMWYQSLVSISVQGGLRFKPGIKVHKVPKEQEALTWGKTFFTLNINSDVHIW